MTSASLIPVRWSVATLFAVLLLTPQSGCRRPVVLRRTPVTITPGVPEGSVAVCVWAPSTFDDPIRRGVSMVALQGGGPDRFVISAKCAGDCSEASLAGALARKPISFVDILTHLHGQGTGHVTVDSDETTGSLRVVTMHANFDATYEAWDPVRAVECLARRPGNQYLIDVTGIVSETHDATWGPLVDGCKRSTEVCSPGK
jgi:hypothetical protein